MKMEIKYNARFRKQYVKADREIKTAFAQTLEIFLEEPNHSTLRNHALREKLAGFRSLDVTDDWRAVFKEKQKGKQSIITFQLLGTHTDLYK